MDWVYKNLVLKRIFAVTREQVAGGWRKLHNDELHNEYEPQNIITSSRSRRWVGHSTYGTDEKCKENFDFKT
jgi:NADH:ubiquinone oxidoreductase subunit